MMSTHVFNPKVSIVIPVYNGSNYLHEAIESALAQTYDNFEVIIVNDGSTDGGVTEQIALAYGDRIRYFHKGNGGVATSLNLGIEKMTGEYFSWLSHDDVYMENKVEENVTALRRLADKNTVIYSDWNGINSKGHTIFKMRYKDHHEVAMLNTSPYPVTRGCLNGCTLLISREIFRDVGVFDSSLPTTQDFDLWIRILEKYSIRYVDKMLVCYRDHEEQTSKKDYKHTLAENSIWIKMMQEFSRSAYRRISPSRRVFYYDIFSHLNQSSLQDALLFSKNRMIEERPLISIILPTYNRGYCLLRAVSSVLRQNFKDFELLIVDDGSTDNTDSIIPDDPRVKYFKKENGGVSSARNFGIDKAMGEFVAFIDSDDEWGPEHLQKHLEYMEKNPTTGLTYSFVDVYDPQGNLCLKAETKISTPFVESILFINKNSLMTPAIMVRKKVFDYIEHFDETMSMCEDLDMWRRIAIYYDLVSVPFFTTTVHLRDNQFDPSRFMKYRYLYIKKAFEDRCYCISNQTMIELLLEIYTTYCSLGITSDDFDEYCRSILKDCPECYKDIIVQISSFEIKKLQTTYQSLQIEHQALQTKHQLLLNSKAVRLSNKLKRIIRKQGAE